MAEELLNMKPMILGDARNKVKKVAHVKDIGHEMQRKQEEITGDVS